MIILSHRGYWREPAEKNRRVAFRRSFDLGFGTETDVRDCLGHLVISHDMPGDDALMLDDLLGMLAGRDTPLAFNIKADGLGRALQAQLRAHGLTRWFSFDMSVPEMVAQIGLGLPVFTRCSEHEATPVLYDKACGIWLDGFDADWYSPQLVSSFLRDGKRVAIVSPELHGREPTQLWQRLGASGITDNPELMLCTDLPEAAAAYFQCGVI